MFVRSLHSLAMAELHLTIATLFRRFELELFDTYRERDIDNVRDFFLGEPHPDTRGVRVRVLREIP